MTDALAGIGRGRYVDPSSKTLLSWSKEWYETYKKPGVKTNTRLKYETSLSRIERAAIASVQLKDLTGEMIQKYYSALSIAGSAQETIKATHIVINGALDKAVEVRLIPFNPAERAIIPRSPDNGEDSDCRALEIKTFEAFMADFAKRSDYYAFAAFMANTGLQPGEALALDRKDLDMKKATVKVTKTAMPDGTVQTSPKTKASRRQIDVPASTVELIKTYMAARRNTTGSAPLFQSMTGTRLNARNVLRMFKTVGKDHDCE